MTDRYPKDAYDRFQDASTTPFLDLLAGVLAMVSVTGGSLALIFAAGTFAAGDHPSQGWPFLAVVAVLVTANVALRRARSRRR
jgi:hypothetical protein